LRALAVAAVIAYHLGYGQVPGGYIGVEVFFVLSGWLVCALLDNERRTEGHVDLKAFWMRRARRLLPAVTLVIATVLIVATLVNYDRFLNLRGDAFAALAYILNWRLIFQNQSYFAAAAGPSPLQHLWSLSIEEQFYLVLPLLLTFLVSKPRLAANAVTVVLGLALASTVWRFALDTPGADPSRLYFGTDTRAAGLLFGAALGLVWVPGRLRKVSGAWAPWLLDLAALSGLAVIAWYTFQVDEHDVGAFAGSLTAVQVGTLVLIAAVVHPASGVVASALSVAPLRWVGQRSYGIYLWHWPIIVLWATAPGEQPESPAVSVALVALTLLLAGLSYRWFEQPIRQRGLAGAFDHLKGWLPGKMLARPAVGGVILGVAVLVGMAGVATAVHVATAPADRLPTDEMAGIGEGELADTPPTLVEPAKASQGLLPAPTPGRTGAAAGAAGGVPTAGGPGAATTAAVARPMPPITGIGDSVMLGAKPSLTTRIGPTIDVEAKVGRQMVDSPEFVEQLEEHGQLGDIVIMHLGANGPFPDSTLDDIVDIIGHRKLLLLNVKVPRRWEGEVNDRLYAAAKRHHEIQIVDWRKVADAEPGLLTRDGYHLTPQGARRYTDVVAEALTEALRPNNPGHGNGHYPS
jgi:peptidoglycan/LPS O-acetylase OafA/YrhL